MMLKKLSAIVGIVAATVAVVALNIGPASAQPAQQVVGMNGACQFYNPNVSGPRVGVAKATAVTNEISVSASFNSLAPNTKYTVGVAMAQLPDGSLSQGCFLPEWGIHSFTTDRKGDGFANFTVAVTPGRYQYQFIASASGNLDLAAVDLPSSLTVPS